MSSSVPDGFVGQQAGPTLLVWFDWDMPTAILITELSFDTPYAVPLPLTFWPGSTAWVLRSDDDQGHSAFRPETP